MNETFVAKKQSFEADDGHNDDLAMTLVMFAWLTSQDYWKDLMNTDIRKELFEDKMKQIEDEMLPFGFIDTGDGMDYEIDDQGDIWRSTEDW